MRLGSAYSGWSADGTRAGLLGTGAMLDLPPMCPSRAPPRRRRPRTRRGGGRGVWAEHLLPGCGRPRERPPRAWPSVWGPRLRAFTPITSGWARRVRRWRPESLMKRGPPGFLGRYLVTVGWGSNKKGSLARQGRGQRTASNKRSTSSNPALHSNHRGCRWLLGPRGARWFAPSPTPPLRSRRRASPGCARGSTLGSRRATRRRRRRHRGP